MMMYKNLDLIKKFISKEVLTGVDVALRLAVKSLYEENEKLKTDLHILRNNPKLDDDRKVISMMLLSGFLSSGRSATVIDGVSIPLEQAAVVYADRLLIALEKKGLK